MFSDGPKGTYWNMYNTSHLEIYLIKWVFFKKWKIIYKDKNNSALPQKYKNKFCTFYAWFREGEGEYEREQWVGAWGQDGGVYGDKIEEAGGRGDRGGRRGMRIQEWKNTLWLK